MSPVAGAVGALVWYANGDCGVVGPTSSNVVPFQKYSGLVKVSLPCSRRCEVFQ